MRSVIDIGEGVKLVKATADDFAALNADMRDADKAEIEVFGEKEERRQNWQAAWAVKDGEHLVGIIGYSTFSDDSMLSKRRLLLFMTTNYVWSIKFKFVKFTPKVVRAVINEMPSYVEEVYSLPMSEYKSSIKWQVRIIGFKVNGEILVNGVKHTVLKAKVSEVKI